MLKNNKWIDIYIYLLLILFSIVCSVILRNKLIKKTMENLAIKNSIDTTARIKIKKYMYIALYFLIHTQDGNQNSIDTTARIKIKKYMYIALYFLIHTPRMEIKIV